MLHTRQGPTLQGHVAAASHHVWSLRTQKVIERVRHKQRATCSGCVSQLLPRDPTALVDLTQVLACTHTHAHTHTHTHKLKVIPWGASERGEAVIVKAQTCAPMRDTHTRTHTKGRVEASSYRVSWPMHAHVQFASPPLPPVQCGSSHHTQLVPCLMCACNVPCSLTSCVVWVKDQKRTLARLFVERHP